MTYVITEPCIDVLDKSCVEVCPVDCIHFEEGTDRMEYIDPDECIDCGACEPVCPVTAIFAEDDVPDQYKEYTELNAKWYKDPGPVRERVNALKPARASRTEPEGGLLGPPLLAVASLPRLVVGRLAAVAAPTLLALRPERLHIAGRHQP
jgi:NAD-dependent dihydropyrimidine dehydrogenase PreA subunit